MPVHRVRIPWRHSVLRYDLPDRFLPPGCIIEGQQGKGTDFTGAMARGAVSMQNGGDIAIERELRLGRTSLHPTDDASDRLGFWDCDRSSGQQILDRVPQFTALRIVACESHAILIVDAPMVADPPVRIQHEHFRGSSGLHGVGQAMSHVFQQRKIECMLGFVGRQLGQTVLTIRVDTDDRDASILVGVIQFIQPRTIQSSERAFHAQKGDHHDGRFIRTRKRCGGAVAVQQFVCFQHLAQFAAVRSPQDRLEQ